MSSQIPFSKRPEISDPVPNWRNLISSGFGNRQSPGNVGSTNHEGIDIKVPTGTPVKSVKDGIVTFVGQNGGYGNTVIIKHKDGFKTLYAHLSSYNVSRNQSVTSGQTIANSGSTGISTGPHLHLGVYNQFDHATNPIDYLNGSGTIDEAIPDSKTSFQGVGVKKPPNRNMGSGWESDKKLLPFAFAVVGQELCKVSSLSISLTSDGEAGTCELSIPLENIDSTIFVTSNQEEKKIPIEIYIGYVNSGTSAEETMSQIESVWDSRSSKKSKFNQTFVKRFDGFVAQPEWVFGDQRMLYLRCFDWSQMLREYRWPLNLKDGETEVSRIFSLIQRNLLDFEISADGYVGTQRMGEKDIESNTINYNSSGKSYWEILQECANKINKKLFISGRAVFIKSTISEQKQWSLYYGPQDKNKDLKKGEYFTNLRLRYGEIGEPTRGNVVIELYSTKTSEKSESKKVYVRFPQDAPLKENTLYIRHVIRANTDESELRVIAENMYKKYAKKTMTGSVELPFANNYIELLDLVRFTSDNPNSDISFLGDYYFVVHSIQERYDSNNGYAQTLEIDTDPDINKSTVSLKGVLAPKHKGKK